MKHTLFLQTFLLLFLPINLFSQQKLSEFQVKIVRPEEVFIATDSLGYMACIFQNSKEYEVDFLDPEHKVIGTAITEKIKADKSQQIIGGILTNEYCYGYFYNKKVNAFSILEVKRATGEASYSRVQIFNKDEQFLRGFDMDGKFYVMIIPKFTNTIRLLVMDGKNMEEKNFNTEMPGFYTALTKNNDKLNIPVESEVGIEEINYNMDNNIKSTYPSKKLYHNNGKIVMTFDEPNLTHLITLDVTNDISNYKKLNFSLDKGNTSHQKQGNSFMNRNRLFRTTMSPEQLNITILDLDSMRLINTYNFFPGDDIAIRNTPMLQEGGNGYGTDEKVIKKSEQFFHRVLSGNLAIAATETDSSTYQMEVGSYEMYTSYRSAPGGSGLGFGGPAISIGMGMGMGMGIGTGFGTGFGYPMGMGMGSPYYSPFYSGYPGYYSNQPINRLKVVYFKSILNKEDLSHKKGDPAISMNDKINEYEYRVFRSTNPEVLRVSPYNRGLVLGYYVKNGKRFNLVEFKR